MKTKNNIYIYSTKKSREKGLIKIGDTLRDDVNIRINQQRNQADAIDEDDLIYELLYDKPALTKTGKLFRDHQIHDILINKKYPKHQIIGKDNSMLKNSTEWFKIDVNKAIFLIESYIDEIPEVQISIDRFQTFEMRPEQKKAVEITKKYFLDNSEKTSEFLWNAKMRFGKTFAAYQLAKSMNLSKILIMTYKPAVKISWEKDLNNHKDFEDYVFLSENELFQIDNYINDNQKVVVFASYQDLLGKKSVSEEDISEIKDKHKALFNTNWDILIVDEFHYGTSTESAKELLHIEMDNKELTKTEQKTIEKEFFSEDDEIIKEEKESEIGNELIKKGIKTKRKLFLSGTPFKALADNRFTSESIFNWSYVDEQKAKEEYIGDNNPYKMLPKILLYVYKVSEDLIAAGIKENKDEFSLNYFFKVEDKKETFRDEKAVKKWLDLITGIIKPVQSLEDEISGREQELKISQYPYDPESHLKEDINHTLWYFNRTNSALAMFKLLKEHPIFKDYHIELVTGDNSKSGAQALPPVERAIQNNKKTITLTVGKLTTGVSVPEWTAVLFLRDTDSPENYFQTAFRAQTPYKDKNGKIKEHCYIFDFSPNRSLKLLTTYSEKLTHDNHSSTSEQKIEEFIKYLPVLKVFGNEMVELDARDILTFDLSGLDAKGIGSKFIERRNIVVTSEVISMIHSNDRNRERCSFIFDKIKMFKKYNVGSSDLKNSDVDLDKLNQNNNKVKDLKTKKTLNKKDKDDLKSTEDKQKSERDKVRELLKTLLSRIPLFMYLTDATEENMDQVLSFDENDLFRKTTGIEIGDFYFLIEMGLMRIESLDGYVLKFKELENTNFDYINRLVEKKDV